MLSVQNLCKYYDKNKLSEQFVLKNISLEFPEAGLVSIFGPSGCGKTTLLNILSGIDTPTSGEVLYNDTEITDDFRYQNVGVIFQDFGLLENKTVEENIRIGYLDASEQVLNDTLKALDILKFKDRKVSMLSGGEKQRVAIARAVIKKPAYILADEPTGNLDLKNRMRVMQILKSLSTHMLVILISHDIELVSKYSDRIITLTDGEVTNDTWKTIEYKNNFDAKIKNSKFNLFSYLKDTYKIKHKTSFLMILFMLATTVLTCFISANVTGYKYKSSPITNNYITFDDSLSPTIFDIIKKNGNFQYSIDVNEFNIPKEKDFIKSYKNLCLKNREIILYPYQNEPILSSIKLEKTDINPVYLSLKLAKRLIKEGRLEEWGLDGYIPLKKLHINNIEDLLGSQIIAGNTYDIVGIVDSKVEGILYTDSYYALHKTYYISDKTYTHSRSIPYSIYKKYNPNAPQIETGEAIKLGSNQIDFIDLKDYGFTKNIIVTEAINEELYLNDKKIQYVLNDYDFYKEFNYSIFHTTHLKEVTAILDAAGISYSLPATYNYTSIDHTSKSILYTVLLSVMIVLLIFSLFFIIVDASNYINKQINDIIILRNMGISKKTMINTYAVKLYLKLLSSFILGFIFSVFATYHLKSFDHETYFFFQINPLTLLLCLIIGAAMICLTIYLYLLKRFRFSAATLKIKNKI